MKKTLEDLIAKALENTGLPAGGFIVEHPVDMKMGDYSSNVAIKHGAKKQEIFEYLQTHLPEGLERAEMVGPGFVNFYLSKEFFQKSLSEIVEKGDEFGKGNHAKGFKVMVEHTQPNPFKEFHIGHLMNNAVGEAVSNIMKANGAEVRTASYHGDVGLHVAKSIWGKLQKTGVSWGEAYVFGSQNFEEHKEEIIILNKKIYEKSDPAINELYEKGRKESLESFGKIYERIGSNFDYAFYESQAGEVGKEIVLANLGKVFERSDGAVVFQGENFEPKTHTRVFLNSENLPTYEGKEVGLAKLKREKWQYDSSVTITANEQDSFFKVVEVAIGEVFPELKGKLKHLSHGLLKLTTGKMSSRTGEVISAETLIEQVKEKVKDDEQVAVGAIKYMILRQSIGNDIIFDFEKSVSTEGDSGVYLQYAHARANSILEKAPADGDSASAVQGEIRDVEKLLYRFPEIIERAGADYAPNHIVTYLTELASAFNNFYAHEQILDNSPESGYRLAVVKAFKTVMKNGLTVLGIPAPERM